MESSSVADCVTRFACSLNYTANVIGIWEDDDLLVFCAQSEQLNFVLTGPGVRLFFSAVAF
jgi:hypothetical protein